MIDGGHQFQWLTAYNRQLMEGHRLDWPGQPSFFKDYSPCTSYPLPLPETLPEMSLFTLSEKTPSRSPLIWNRHSLASLLLLTSAPTARSTFAEGEIWYRSNASAGALYPLEFYLSFPGADDLPAGLYHYDLLKPALGLLKQRGKAISEPAPEIAFLAAGIRGLSDGLYLFDWLAGCFALFDDQDRRREVAQASLDQRWLERAALQFLFFADLESAQEIYGLRSYRYLQIAAGRLGQLLYLGATALGLGCCAVGAFYDRELAQVCLIPENFDPLYLVAVGPVAGGL